MDALEIKISLPETLAREAEAMGLLAPEAIEALFSAELDRRAHAEEVAAIQIGIDQFERGEGRPARGALQEIAAKQGVGRFDFKAAQQETAGLWPEEDSADDFVAAVREWRQQGQQIQLGLPDR